MEIVLKNITKEFGNIKAVDNLNIKIEDGELISILGPSGCGKSTTLFLIAGLYEPTVGKIYFDSKDVTSLEPKDRGIGMVFQNYALYPHLTVSENIEFPLKMKKVKKGVRVKKAREMAKLTKIEELLQRKPSELSGGQQQRVAIARALVKEPSILLLDEPLSNLDAGLRIEMREEIRRIQKEVKITTLFVTHDQEEAMSISDKILLIKDGKFQQYASPKEMYLNPKNKFVASFLGKPSINFLSGYIEGKRFILSDTDIGFKIDRDKYNLDTINTLGVRPEDFVIKGDGPIEVEISNIQTMGREVYIIGKLENGEDILFISSWDKNLSVGDKVRLTVKRTHFFN